MSQARRPRALVRLNEKATIPVSFFVESNTHFQADTFRVNLEAWNQRDGFGMNYWADAENVMVEILIGFLLPGQDEAAIPDNLTSLLIGQVDDVDVDPTTGELMISGRDLTGKLIDTKTSNMWPSQTASEIVTRLATEAGLTPKVTKTTTPVGNYTNGFYSALGREVPLWDLITSMAQREGFDAYVTGTTLYFGPIEADNDKNPYEISCFKDAATGRINSSVERLSLRRSLTLAKDITVTVLSHSVYYGTPIKAVAKRQGSAKSGRTSFRSGQTSQNYVIRRPNMTQDQANKLAQKTLADLSRYERTFHAQTYDDGLLTTKRRVRISGTGSSWDQAYYIDKLTREFEFGELTMQISGKNHPVESQPNV